MPPAPFLLLLITGVVALLERPQASPFTVVLVVTGGAALAAQVLMKHEGAAKFERLGACLSGFAIGAGGIYLAIELGGLLGWTVFIIVLCFGALLAWGILRVGVVVFGPGVRWLRRELVKPHPFGVFLVVAVLLALGASVAAKADPMPGIALGSPVVLYVERAAALFGVLLLLFTILVQAWKGVLPSEVSPRGVRYEEFKEKAESVLDSLRTANQGFAKAIGENQGETKALEKEVSRLADLAAKLTTELKELAPAPENPKPQP